MEINFLKQLNQLLEAVNPICASSIFCWTLSHGTVLCYYETYEITLLPEGGIHALLAKL